MKIYEQEILDGLEHKISSSASFSYSSQANPCDKEYSKIKENIKSLASLKDEDLYYVQSILVSTTWNKNDDIFDKEEVWLARHTPEDKPTNLEHDESIIIGHITSNWPITEDGNLIDENISISELPEKYHILTGSVIYTAYTNPELKERADNLIHEIASGTKYVSMECFFKGFDYGLINKTTGKYKILARNEQTAHLTKYLRAYGGLGEHEDYKIGRVLRNITFSGKGFVDKPANPDSIIFNKNLLINNVELEKKDNFNLSGVSNCQSTFNSENNTMSLDLEPVMKEVAEIKTKIEAMEIKTAEAASETIAQLEAQNTELKTVVSAHESKIAELTSALDQIHLEKEEAAKKKSEEDTSKDEEMNKVKSELIAANEIIAGYKANEAEMMKKEQKMKRVATLIEAGVDSEVATSTVEKFEALDDEAFDAMTSLFAGKMPPWLDKNKKKEEEVPAKKKASEEVVDVAVLETAEPQETVELGIGGDTVESPVASTRAALVDFVYSRLGNKLNKGE